MPDDFLPFPRPPRKPTPERPLLGQTLLVVEDSRFASDAVRLMALHSGARLRRADCLASAHRHLAVYRPSVVLVDLGLPDGPGLDLIRELNTADPRVPVLLATSGDDGAEAAALAGGADGFLPKPIANLLHFQQEILSHLPVEGVPRGPRLVAQVDIAPDPVALRDDLAHVATLLEGAPDADMARYIGQFIHSLGVSGNDAELVSASNALADSQTQSALDRVRSLVRDRLAEPATF